MGEGYHPSIRFFFIFLKSIWYQHPSRVLCGCTHISATQYSKLLMKIGCYWYEIWRHKRYVVEPFLNKSTRSKKQQCLLLSYSGCLAWQYFKFRRFLVISNDVLNPRWQPSWPPFRMTSQVPSSGAAHNSYLLLQSTSQAIYQRRDISEIL